MEIIKRLKTRYWFVLEQVWQVCSKPDASLKLDVLEQKLKNKDVLKHYVLPMAEMLMVHAFVMTIFAKGEWQFANAVVKGLFTALTFVLSFVALCSIVRALTVHLFMVEPKMRNIKLMIGMALSLTFVVKVLQLLFPYLFFIPLFYLYMFYLVWALTGDVIAIPEEKRNKYMVSVTFVVIFIPVIIMYILSMMVPNLLN